MSYHRGDKCGVLPRRNVGNANDRVTRHKKFITDEPSLSFRF